MSHELHLKLIFWFQSFYSIDPDFELQTSSQTSTSSNDSEPQPKRGRVEVPFSKAVQRTKLYRTDDVGKINKLKSQNLDISYEELLIFLLKREAGSKGDKEAVDFFRNLLENGIPKEKKVDAEKGFFIK